MRLNRLSFLRKNPNLLRQFRQAHWTSNAVRSTFIEFFKQHDHHFVKSSPVIPWKDPSLSFVNAGMNQFKPMFLGLKHSPFPRVVNSQKCIRVGGKHNDLEQVGMDTYHHTFFEMLGSWSFNDYFKKEACQMAWTLLTEEYKIPPERLYVTYFGGNVALGLEPDIEALDIWKNIGVASDHILPCGMKDNFWEMGLIGPCGPSTEIHYDRVGLDNASTLVNQGHEDVIELWNLVFIQYERLRNGSLEKLSGCFVDTGLGLERLTASLNGYRSNYDSDLFTPLFNTIQRVSGKPAYGGKFSNDGQCLDTAYRILADHARMITVALADGAILPKCTKLRQVLQRMLTTGRQQFDLIDDHGWLEELITCVSTTLHDSYPELSVRLNHCHYSINQEIKRVSQPDKVLEREWKDLVTKEPRFKVLENCYNHPIILSGNKLLTERDKWLDHNNGNIPPDTAFNIFIKAKLDIEQLEIVANILNLKLDVYSLEENLNKLNEVIKTDSYESLVLSNATSLDIISTLKKMNIPITNNSEKYSYDSMEDGTYHFKPLKTKIIGLISEGELTKSVKCGDSVGVILENSNFYYNSGGQICDNGVIRGDNNEVIRINDVENVANYVIHKGKVEGGVINCNDNVSCYINEETRLGASTSHSTIHLLNSAIKLVAGDCTQIASKAAQDDVNLEVFTYKMLTIHDISLVEQIIQFWIAEKSAIIRESMSFIDAMKADISFLPGMIYPEIVSTISSSLPIPTSILNHQKHNASQTASSNTTNEEERLLSSELCCGTHLHNTNHIKHFVIIQFKNRNRRAIIKAVCGDAAAIIIDNGNRILDRLPELEKECKSLLKTTNLERLTELDKELKGMENCIVPRNVANNVAVLITNLLPIIKRKRTSLWYDEEISNALTNNQTGPFIYQLSTPPYTFKKINLEKYANLCKHRPVLLLVKNEKRIRCYASLPQVLVDKGASATEWMSTTCNKFDGKYSSSKNPLLACYFSSLDTYTNQELDSALPNMLLAAKNYINNIL